MICELPENESDIELMPLALAIQNLERAMIKKAYEQSGSIVKATKLLDINPSTINESEIAEKSYSSLPNYR